MSNQIASRPGPDLELLATRFAQIEESLGAIADRLGRLEQNAAALGEQASVWRNRADMDSRRMENQLKELTAAIECSRAAGAQTDNLVERVVEALESLQSRVSERTANGTVGVN
ncbi:MAG: hypothetical protein ABSB23_20125 [Bryobacteraceae bacterium]